MRRTVLCVLGCILASSGPAQAATRTMWVWKDANGVPHYSDVPVPGAVKKELYSAEPSAAPAPPAPVASVQTTPLPASARTREYTALEFVAPEKDATFFGPDNLVEASLRIDPGLMQGDELTWYLDGNRLDAARNQLSYTFKELPRGTHTINAVVRDADGIEKIRSLSRSFTVRQMAVDNPRNVGPALKPKPTPTPAPKPPPPKPGK